MTMTYSEGVCGVVLFAADFMIGAVRVRRRPAARSAARQRVPRLTYSRGDERGRRRSPTGRRSSRAGRRGFPAPDCGRDGDARVPARGATDFPRLPLVVAGDAQKRTEEETRESLRRFLATAAPLLGIDLKHVSLVEVSDAAAVPGARRALYRQNPFAYPLPNGYGSVEVTFTPDLRVVGLASTAVPDAERLGRTLAAVPKTVTAAQAVAALANPPSPTTTAPARTDTHAPNTRPDGRPTARRLPFRRDAAAGAALELHVAGGRCRRIAPRLRGRRHGRRARGEARP